MKAWRATRRRIGQRDSNRNDANTTQQIQLDPHRFDSSPSSGRAKLDANGKSTETYRFGSL